MKRWKDASTQKEQALRRVYRTIYTSHPIDKQTIMDELSLASTTCTRLLDELVRARLIYEVGAAPSSGGRRALLYDIAKEAYYVFGVDIHSTVTRVVLVDLRLTFVEERVMQMDRMSTPHNVWRFIVEAIESLMDDYMLQRLNVLGVGISAFGPLDEARRVIVGRNTMRATGWRNVRLVDWVRRELQLFVTLEERLRAALQAECVVSAEQPTHAMLVAEDDGQWTYRLRLNGVSMPYARPLTDVSFISSVEWNDETYGVALHNATVLLPLTHIFVYEVPPWQGAYEASGGDSARLQRSTLGERAAAIGGAYAVLQHYMGER